MNIENGELITILGPSGCGKSTLLRCIAGITLPDSGEITINGILFSSGRKNSLMPAEKRNIGFVFQNYALWPHKNIFENVAYPLKLKKIKKAELKRRVGQMLEMVRLEGSENKYPHQLSGGEQQRVAFARALATNPQLLLLDEPLSNLDAKLREQMQNEIKNIQREFGITTVHVTHDQSEALSMSDRIAIMDNGRIMQIDTPFKIYSNPSNEFVANFIGKTNFIYSDDNIFGSGIQDYYAKSKNVYFSIRPEDLTVSSKTGEESGVVKSVKYKGDSIEYTVNINGKDIFVKTGKNDFFEIGQRVFLNLKKEALSALKCS